jgi:hypothetical protein
MKKFNNIQSRMKHILLMLLTITVCILNAQDQAIGSFPTMQGGFEKFNTGNLTVNLLATGTPSTEWTVSHSSSTTSTINTTTARTGSRFLQFNSTVAAARWWQTPTTPDGNTAAGIQNGGNYIIQYYYRTSGAITSLLAQLNTDGRTGGAVTTTAPTATTSDAWTKAVVSITASTASTANPRYGVGGFRSNSGTTVNVDVDDYVVYQGTEADVTASDAPTTLTLTPASNQIGVSWTAPAGGVDGGGYMVVRHTSDPTTTPTTNGIYGVGNTIGSGTVVYIGSATSFADVSLTPNTQYYYRVYTVDKAFNYSTALTGSQFTERRTITSVGSGAWGTAGTWDVNSVPTQNDNVLIANGHVVTFTGTTNAYNLTVNSGAQIYNITGSPTYTLGNISIYGTSITVNGTFGDPTTEYVSGILFNQNCTLNGSGTIRINRIRPLNTATNATFTFDADATLTNNNAVTLICESSTAGSSIIGYKINSGRTVTTLGTFSGGSNGTLNASNDITLTVDGTLNANSAINLNAVSGKSANLVVNGTLNVTKFYASNQATGGGAMPTITVNGSGVINITGTNAIADFSNIGTAANITGTGTFALATGATISIGSVDGLNSTTGPLRCTTRNLSTAANYSFTGTSAQVTGADLPSTVNTLTNTNTAGLTLSSNLTTTTLTNAATYILNVDAGKQLTVNTTLTNNGIINLKSTGSGTATLIPPTTITGTGVFNAQQHLSTTRNWYISSPVTGAAFPGGYTYYQRNEAGANWTTPIAESTFTQGKGYIALPGSAASTLTFSGTLNTGNVTIPLTWSGASAKGFNLIGNPYPSHLTWTQAFAGSTTTPDGGIAPATLIEPSIYIRTNSGGTSNSTGTWSFQTYNATNGLAVPTHSLLSGGIIPPMQAFWVRAKVAGNLVLNSDLTKSHQTGNPLKAPAVKNTNRQLIRLEVSNGTRTDETLMLFDANALNSYDPYDSPKFAEASSEVQIYTTVDNEKLVMNGMKNLPLDQVIGLGFIPGSSTSFSLKASEISNLPTGVKVILKDNATLAETDLTNGVTAYTFSLATTSGDRFSVIFRTAGVSTNIEKPINNTIQVFVNINNQITIIAPEKATYSIYNAMGQKVAEGITKANRTVVNGINSSGVYVVLITENGRNSSSRVILNGR